MMKKYGLVLIGVLTGMALVAVIIACILCFSQYPANDDSSTQNIETSGTPILEGTEWYRGYVNARVAYVSHYCYIESATDWENASEEVLLDAERELSALQSKFLLNERHFGLAITQDLPRIPTGIYPVAFGDAVVWTGCSYHSIS